MTTTLAAAIAAASDRFGAAYPLYGEPPADAEVVPVERALSAEHRRRYFERAIAMWSDHPETDNFHAAASNFIRRYCGSVVAAALIPLAHGVAVDASPRRLSLVIRHDEPRGAVLDVRGARWVTTPERPTTWPVRGTEVATLDELRHQAIRSLVADNLGPTIAMVAEYASLAAGVMWTSAAEQIYLVYEGAWGRFDDAGFAELERDRDALLRAESLPGIEGENPMRDRITLERVVPEFPRPTHVREVCCACVLASGRGRVCVQCPRSTPQERAENWRRRAAGTLDKV